VVKGTDVDEYKDLSVDSAIFTPRANSSSSTAVPIISRHTAAVIFRVPLSTDRREVWRDAV
jgi:hypothetical protein